MAGSRLLLFPLSILLVCAVAPCLRSAPQEQQSPAAPTEHAKNKRQRLLGLISTPAVANGQATRPLSPRQKFELAVKGTANPMEVALAAFKAEYYRGLDPYKKIGHGGTGYLKQWGAAYLDEASANMLNTFLYPSLLHQDPRYYRQGEGSVWSRSLCSLSQVFVTRGDSGQKEFNFSLLLGNASATALSTLYYPRAGRNGGRIGINIAWSLLGAGARNAFEEFWPDVARRLSQRR